MNKKLLISFIFVSLLPAISYAQWLGFSKKEEPKIEESQKNYEVKEIVSDSKNIATNEETIIEPAPVAPTAEEIVNAKKPLMKSIQISTVNATPQEREKLIDAITTIDKIQARRHNRKVAPEKQIKISDPNVNSKDRKAVQKFLNDKYVAPIGKFSDNQE